ncbi:MAG: hypothetical protein RSK76_12055, partial [Clostridia bacterium]
ANTVRPYIRPFSSDNTMIIAWIGSGIMQYGVYFLHFIINDFTNIGSWRQFVRANTVRPYIRPFSSDDTMIIA